MRTNEHHQTATSNSTSLTHMNLHQSPDKDHYTAFHEPFGEYNMTLSEIKSLKNRLHRS